MFRTKFRRSEMVSCDVGFGILVFHKIFDEANSQLSLSLFSRSIYLHLSKPSSIYLVQILQLKRKTNVINDNHVSAKSRSSYFLPRSPTVETEDTIIDDDDDKENKTQENTLKTSSIAFCVFGL